MELLRDTPGGFDVVDVLERAKDGVCLMRCDKETRRNLQPSNFRRRR